MKHPVYIVIHYSDNWVYGPCISRYDTLREAKAYIKSFRGSTWHKDDTFEIVKTVAKGKACYLKDDNDKPIGLKVTK